jgi:nucleotide-binding universal stress UspA family protein
VTLLVGLAPDERSGGALALAGLLARSTGEDLVVTTVAPHGWDVPSLARVDADFTAHLAAQAREALDAARQRLGDEVHARFEERSARSVPAGILDATRATDAGLVVLGSSTHGALGRVTLGSVTDRLLHSAPVPVAIAPRGYRPSQKCFVRRLTYAYDGAPGIEPWGLGVAAMATRIKATLRLASFGVRPREMVTAGVGAHAEDKALSAWATETADAQEVVRAHLEKESGAALPVETVIGTGSGWVGALEAVEWDDGDVLVLGSSSEGALARVFIGSRATKIITRASVPVVVLPRVGA